MKRTGALGKVYEDGEVIVRQGEAGNCMYVIQDGQAEVVVEKDGEEERLAILGLVLGFSKSPAPVLATMETWYQSVRGPRIQQAIPDCRHTLGRSRTLSMKRTIPILLLLILVIVLAACQPIS